MDVKISPTTLKTCENFADARLGASANLYKKRGEQQISKIRQDIITGTVAEFAVQQFLKLDGRNCSAPDLTIYPATQKSYASDLCSEGLDVHVKAQDVESANRWGLSWLFQKKDPVIKLPKAKDYVCFCKVSGRSVQIKAIVRAKKLLEEHLISELRLSGYNKTKKAVYYDELVASGINLFEL